MSRKSMLTVGIAAWLAVLGGLAISAQDKYDVKVPGGLALSEFRGYEGWQAISISRNERVVAMILGNPAMIDAYQAGFPATASPSLTAPRWPRSTGPRNRTSSSRRHRCRATW